MTWTVDQIEILRKLFSEGQSASQIAVHLHMSRNMVCGKLSRLGLFRKVNNPKPQISVPKHSPRSRIRITQANTNSNGMRVSITHEPTLPQSLRVVNTSPRGVNLLELSPNGCRYPDGDHPVTFCDHPQTAGSSYCRAHADLCRNKHAY